MRRTLGTLAFTTASTLLGLTLAGYAETLNPVFEALTNFRLHLVALAGALALVLALVRVWSSAGLALLTALIAAVGLGPVYDAVERPANGPTAGRTLTLLYANLRALNQRPQALGAMLRATDADILITSETPRAVAESLRAAYTHNLVHSGTGEILRTAIWSKYPLRGGMLYLNNTVAPTGATAIADLGGGATLGLIGAHFSRPFEGLHRTQIEALGPMAKSLAALSPAQPLALAGDFNTSPWSQSVARAAEVTGTRILGGYRVTWRGQYQTPLGPLPEPWGHQIDQILLSPDIGIEAVDALELPGSDHLGLLVSLRIPAP